LLGIPVVTNNTAIKTINNNNLQAPSIQETQASALQQLLQKKASCGSKLA
jgi:hypothetical protein